MSDQVTTYTPELLAWALEDAGFHVVAETITSLREAIDEVGRLNIPGGGSATYRVDIAWAAIDKVLLWAAHCVDLPSGTCSYVIQNARNAGWPEAENLITRQVECLTGLRSLCEVPGVSPTGTLQALAIYIDESGMGS